MTLTRKTLATVLTVAASLSLTVAVAQAAEPMDKMDMSSSSMPAMTMPKPTPEHMWLHQMAGEWESETKAMMMPGSTPEVTKGRESIRTVGSFWTVADIQGTMMQQPFNGTMTLGYDVDHKKYVATWVDSMTGKMWQYEGTVDPTGKILTLETEGTCPMSGKAMKVKDIIEMKDSNTKVYTSMMMGDDGKWVTMMTSTAHRVK